MRRYGTAAATTLDACLQGLKGVDMTPSETGEGSTQRAVGGGVDDCSLKLKGSRRSRSDLK